MFAIYTEQGRNFRNTLEELYRVEGITPVKGLKQLSSDEQKKSTTDNLQSAANNKAIQAYRQVINARKDEPIYHASQIMKRPVITVTETTPTADCYTLMEQKGIKQLPVLNQETKPVGMITKESLLKILIVENNQIIHVETKSIQSIISQPMITADPVSDIRRVAKVMYDQKLNCIPVTNEADMIVGIITRTDIVHAVSIYPGITLWA